MSHPQVRAGARRRHVQQPAGSKLCGPACVAVLAGVSLARATLACSSRSAPVTRHSGTTEAQLRLGLAKLGYLLLPSTRGIVWTGRADLPLLCRLTAPRRAKGSDHWVVLDGGVVHAPECRTGQAARTYLLARWSATQALIRSYAAVVPLQAFSGASRPTARPRRSA